MKTQSTTPVTSKASLMADGVQQTADGISPTTPAFVGVINYASPNGQPKANQSGHVTSFSDLDIELNGKSYSIKAGDSTEIPVSTDSKGRIAFSIPGGLTSAQFDIIFDDLPFTYTIVPDRDNLIHLSNLTGPELATATSYDKASLLLPEYQQSSDSIAKLITSIVGQQTESTAQNRSLVSTVPTFYSNISSNNVDFSTSNPAQHQLHLDYTLSHYTKIGGSFFDTIEDYTKHVVEGAEHVISVSVNFIENVADIIIHSVENAFHLTVKTLDHAAKVVEGIVKKIAGDIMRFIEFMSYVFEWDDILNTKDLLVEQVKTSTDAMQVWVKKQVAEAQSALNSFFVKEEKEVKDDFNNLRSMLGMKKISDFSSSRLSNSSLLSAVPLNGSTFDIFSPAMWLVNKAINAIEGLALNDIGEDLYDKIANFATTVADELKNNPDMSGFGSELQNIIDRLTRFFSSESSLNSGLSDLLSIFENISLMVMQLGNAVGDGFLNLLNDSIQLLIDFLEKPLIKIPFISDFYSTITNGDSLSILNLVSLIVAVPTTVLYKAAYNRRPGDSDPAYAAELNYLADARVNGREQAASWLSVAAAMLGLVLEPFWVVGDISDFSYGINVCIAGITAVDFALTFAQLITASSEMHDYVFLVLSMGSLFITILSAYGSKEGTDAWSKSAPGLYCLFGSAMILMSIIYATKYEDNYWGKSSNKPMPFIINIAGFLPYAGQPLRFIKGDGQYAIALIDFLGFSTNSILTILNSIKSLD